MQISDLIYRLKDWMEQEGDHEIVDSDWFSVEDVEFDKLKETYIIYSEGDEH